MSRDRLPKIDEWRFGTYRVTVHVVLKYGLHFKGFRARIIPLAQDAKTHGLVTVDGDDLLKLKNEVADRINGMRDITWTTYLLVEFGEANSYGGGDDDDDFSEGLQLEVSTVQQGVDKKGAKFHRGSERGNAQKGSYDAYKKGQWSRGFEKGPYVILPYSKETVADLKNFAKMLKELRQQMEKFVTKDQIAGVLAKIREKQPLALPMPVDIKSTKKPSLKKRVRGKTK